MKTKNNYLLLAATSLLLLGFTSCSKDDSNSGQKLDIYLTDGPGDFDAVFIDITAVEIKVDTSAAHRHDDRFGDNDGHGDDHLQRRDGFGVWQTVNFTPGIYDVLQLRNGIDSLIASTTVNGTVRKIRFTLGANNSVVVGGVTYPLTLVNTTNNFLYVNLNDRHRGRGNGGSMAVWVDFDLGRSIVYANGVYYLKPVLRPFCNTNFGEVEGRVLPLAARATVKVYNNTDTAVAIPNPDGRFKVRGLTPGNYSVLIDGTSPYIDTTLTNVNVVAGRDTRLGEITLRQ